MLPWLPLSPRRRRCPVFFFFIIRGVEVEVEFFFSLSRRCRRHRRRIQPYFFPMLSTSLISSHLWLALFDSREQVVELVTGVGGRTLARGRRGGGRAGARGAGMRRRQDRCCRRWCRRRLLFLVLPLLALLLLLSRGRLLRRLNWYCRCGGSCGGGRHSSPFRFFLLAKRRKQRRSRGKQKVSAQIIFSAIR